MSEKLQILKMVEDGKITASEGTELLEALDNSIDEYVTEESKNENSTNRFLRIKIIEPNENTKVNVNLPISLVNVGLRLAEKFSPEFKEAGLTEEDISEIFQAIKSGNIGKIVEVDSDDGTKVEITIE